MTFRLTLKSLSRCHSSVQTVWNSRKMRVGRADLKKNDWECKFIARSCQIKHNKMLFIVFVQRSIMRQNVSSLNWDD